MNYHERARTNYFRVKDQEALEEFAEKASLQLERKGDLVAIIAEGGIPSTVFDEELEDDVIVDFSDEVCKFLADGEILILQGNGYEGMRCLTGWASAFDNTGKVVTISIDEIYAKAAKAFDVKEENITRAIE